MTSISVAGLLLFWGVCLGGTINRLMKLKAELAYLPSMSQSNRLLGSAYGKNIHDFMTVPAQLLEQPVVVLVSSPTCAFCHDLIHESINMLPKLDIPFFTLVEASSDKSHLPFIKEYGEQMPIVAISSDTLNRMEINTFPMIWILDQKGTVAKELHLLEHAIKFYRELYGNRRV
ncbi:hypothetical protein ACTID9_00650 [Brevibacillus fluminis]|uniref:hypothetical protein n=1 Tax=Brevibacillus fluminis TaxID=511487 RepID=UPI003F891716